MSYLAIFDGAEVHHDPVTCLCIDCVSRRIWRIPDPCQCGERRPHRHVSRGMGVETLVEPSGETDP